MQAEEKRRWLFFELLLMCGIISKIVPNFCGFLQALPLLQSSLQSHNTKPVYNNNCCEIPVLQLNPGIWSLTGLQALAISNLVIKSLADYKTAQVCTVYTFDAMGCGCGLPLMGPVYRKLCSTYITRVIHHKSDDCQIPHRFGGFMTHKELVL